MLDTSPEMQKKQLEIVLSKSPEERVQMGYDIINFGYKTVRNSIIAQHPEISKAELAIAIFKRYYAHEFSIAQINEITDAMLAFYKK